MADPKIFSIAMRMVVPLRHACDFKLDIERLVADGGYCDEVLALSTASDSDRLHVLAAELRDRQRELAQPARPVARRQLLPGQYQLGLR